MCSVRMLIWSAAYYVNETLHIANNVVRKVCDPIIIMIKVIDVILVSLKIVQSFLKNKLYKESYMFEEGLRMTHVFCTITHS